MMPAALMLLTSLAFTQQPVDSGVAARPFHVGERFQYAAKLGFLRLGTAWMSVNSIDTLRGDESFVFEFGLEASAPFYKSTSVMQSWTGTADMISRRFTQKIVENGRPTNRHFDIFPDSLFYTQEERPGKKPSVAEPLDDAAFFYFLRTIPLEIEVRKDIHGRSIPGRCLGCRGLGGGRGRRVLRFRRRLRRRLAARRQQALGGITAGIQGALIDRSCSRSQIRRENQCQSQGEPDAYEYDDV